MICFDSRDGERLSSSLVQITKGSIICGWCVVLQQSQIQLCVDVRCKALPGRQDADIDFHHSLPGSQRRSHLHEVGLRTMRSGQSFFIFQVIEN
jgi:hypothetical protein